MSPCGVSSLHIDHPVRHFSYEGLPVVAVVQVPENSKGIETYPLRPSSCDATSNIQQTAQTWTHPPFTFDANSS